MLLTGPTKPAELGEWNTWLTYTIMALSIQCEREALLQTLGIPCTLRSPQLGHSIQPTSRPQSHVPTVVQSAPSKIRLKMFSDQWERLFMSGGFPGPWLDALHDGQMLQQLHLWSDMDDPSLGISFAHGYRDRLCKHTIGNSIRSGHVDLLGLMSRSPVIRETSDEDKLV